MDIIWVDEALKVPFAEFQKLLPGFAFKYFKQLLIGIEEFFLPIGAVNEKGAGNIGQPVGHVLPAEFGI